MRRRQRTRAIVLAACSMTAAAALAVDHPAAPAPTPGDATSLVSGVAGWAAWVLGLYLLAGLGAGAVASLRGMPGTLLPAPAVLRRLVDVLVGASATVVVVAMAPAAASADTGQPTATAATTQVPGAPLDWPGLHAAGPARPTATTAHRDVEIVRAGDSLWSISQRQLGAAATPAQVAAAWPRIYAMNRRVIGTNPDLIHPGQQLTLPSSTGGAQ